MDLATILTILISRLLGFSSLKFISHDNFDYPCIVQASSRFGFIHNFERQRLEKGVYVKRPQVLIDFDYFDYIDFEIARF